MPLPKWFVVARNDYRVRTSWLGKLRPYFLFVAAALLAVYLVYLAPALVSLIITDLLATFLSQAAVPLTQILLLMFFFFFVTFPISTALQEARTGQLETFLSSPIRSGDILLGEFMGMLPFYAILITAVTGFFTAILHPLGLGPAQIVITILIFVITLVAALWIGAVAGAVVRTKLGRTAYGKDVGRALAILIVLPAIAVLYAIMGGGLLQALVDPETSRTISSILIVLPSSWGAQVFGGFVANPGNIAATWFETLGWFGGLVLFFVATLWLGGKVANKAYSLELMSFTAPVARREGGFYGTIRWLTGGRSLGSLLVSVFKEYGRRVENLSWVAYSVGIYALVTIFWTGSEGPFSTLIFASFLLPLLAAAVAGDVTLRGRETLFICRKAPYGERRYLLAVLFKSWMVAVPAGVLIIVISTALIQQGALTTILWNAGYIAQFVAALTVFAVGLFLLFPVPGDATRERTRTRMMVFTVMMLISLVLFIVSVRILGVASDTFLMIHVSGIWLLGVVSFFLGRRRLNTME